MTGLSDTAKYSYQMWTDSTRYLTNVSGAMNATAPADSAAQANATFAEVFPAPNY